MIPKTIHYCWFGRNPKPELAEKCIKSWKKYCPNYEIIEWNEDNYDLSSAPLYVRQAYEAKKWAFVTDYVRLHVVYDQGGIYLDTDVELIKSLDSLLCHQAYFGFEDGVHIATGLGFGAVKGNEVVRCMLVDYKDAEFYKPDGSIQYITCPDRNTKAISHLLGNTYDGRRVVYIPGAVIYPMEFFCPLDWKTKELKITENTYSIHWYDASWLKEDQKVLTEYIAIRKRISKMFGNRAGSVLVRIMYALFYPDKWKIIKRM